jgi:hypothetical protein
MIGSVKATATDYRAIDAHTGLNLACEVELVHSLDIRGEDELALYRPCLDKTAILIADLHDHALIRHIGDFVVAHDGRVLAKLMPQYPCGAWFIGGKEIGYI